VSLRVYSRLRGSAFSPNAASGLAICCCVELLLIIVRLIVTLLALISHDIRHRSTKAIYSAICLLCGFLEEQAYRLACARGTQLSLSSFVHCPTNSTGHMKF
jgi:hypothetical protein